MDNISYAYIIKNLYTKTKEKEGYLVHSQEKSKFQSYNCLHRMRMLNITTHVQCQEKSLLMLYTSNTYEIWKHVVPQKIDSYYIVTTRSVRRNYDLIFPYYEKNTIIVKAPKIIPLRDWPEAAH